MMQNIIDEDDVINEEEGDVTLKMSPEKEQLVSRIEYEDNDNGSVPILQFDINQVQYDSLQTNAEREDQLD